MSALTRPLPPRLFKYQPLSTYSLENLRNRTLWFSDPKLFNDPFDCAFSLIHIEPTEEELTAALAALCARVNRSASLPRLLKQDDEYRAKILSVLNETSQLLRGPGVTAGVASLAESPTELLMWAHYANGHRGVCLEFDTAGEPFARAKPVSYSRTIPAFNRARFLLDVSTRSAEAAADSITDMLLMTKADSWQYEREWRIVINEPNTLYSYSSPLLKAVHCGAAMVALALADSPTELFKARLGPNSFDVTTESVTTTSLTPE